MVSADVTEGSLEWTVKPGKNNVSIDMQFTPKEGKCPCKNLAFVQVVIGEWLNNQDGTTKNIGGPFDKMFYGDKESGPYVDINKGDKDPYYNAIWDNVLKKWVDAGGQRQLLFPLTTTTLTHCCECV